MEITVIQAILIGISCWLGSVENPQPLGVAFSDALSKPIVGGTIVGMILGDIPTGVTIGAAIQAMYLGQVLIGGVATADMAFVSYPSIALAMLAGADATVAVTLAATVGVLGAAVFTGYEILCSVFYQLGDKYIAENNIQKMKMAYIVLPPMTSFVIRFGLTYCKCTWWNFTCSWYFYIGNIYIKGFQIYYLLFNWYCMYYIFRFKHGSNCCYWKLFSSYVLYVYGKPVR